MITIIFVCVIDVILDVMYSKYEANTDSQQGVGKVCRATIVEKWKKLTKNKQRKFGMMAEDPILDVCESSVMKWMKRKIIKISMTNVFNLVIV